MRIPLIQLLSMVLMVVVPATGTRADEPKAQPQESAITLKPYRVKARPISSFGIALYGVADKETRRLLQLFVSEVVPDSEAAAKGLKPGTEILAADNLEVCSLDACFEPGSECNRLFINRRAGDKIVLKIIDEKGVKPRCVMLTEPSK